jgi:hypothetical protein
MYAVHYLLAGSGAEVFFIVEFCFIVCHWNGMPFRDMVSAIFGVVIQL